MQISVHSYFSISKHGHGRYGN